MSTNKITNPEKGSPATSDLHERAADLAAQALLVQTYSVAVQKQTDLILVEPDPDLDALAAKIVTARSDAKAFLDGAKPKVFNELAGIIDFADTFAGFQDAFGDALDEWQNAGTNGDLKDLASALEDEIGVRLTALREIAKLLSDQQTALSKDNHDLDAGVSLLTSSLPGDRGIIAKLKKDVATAENDISKHEVGIGVSSAVLGVGALIIVAGVASAVLTGGGGAGAAAFGVVVVLSAAGADAGETVALKNALNRFVDKRGLLEQAKALLKPELAALINLNASVNHLLTVATRAGETVGNLIGTWTALQNDIAAIRLAAAAASDAAKPGTIADIRTFLNAAASQWASLHTFALDLQNRFGPVQVVEFEDLTPEAVLSALHQQASASAG